MDLYLWPVIEAASAAELAVLSRLLAEHAIGYTAPLRLGSLESRRMLHDTVQRAGGHALGNLLRSGGPGWKDTVFAAAKLLRIPQDDLDPPALEQRIAARLIVYALRTLKGEERAKIEATFLRALSPETLAPITALMHSEATPTDADFARVSAGLLEWGVPDDPALLDGSVRVLLWLVVGRFAQKKLPVALLRALVAGPGPTAVVSAVQMAGPAYRLTIPAIVWVAVVRARTET